MIRCNDCDALFADETEYKLHEERLIHIQNKKTNDVLRYMHHIGFSLEEFENIMKGRKMEYERSLRK